MSTQHAMFTAANTQGSIEASDFQEQASFGAYINRDTIQEETDLSLMEERRGLGASLNKDFLPSNKRQRNHGRYLSHETGNSAMQAARTTARTTFMNSTRSKLSPSNFLGPDPRFTATNHLRNNQEFFRATHSGTNSALKPASRFDISQLEMLPAEFITTLNCR